LASEALGCQLVALSRSGRNAQARSLAVTYLERYPDGPYAEAARKLTSSEGAD
jgi:hypothetical protein